VSQPHFGQVWGWSPTLGKVGGLESSGTPECSELNIKAQNTSHWGVLGVIRKVLKRRYRKWPRIGNSDIWAQVMGKRRAGSQTNNLTPDHKKSGIDLFPTSPWKVQHGVGKLSTRATTLIQDSSRSEFGARSYGCSKFREFSRDTFGIPFQESQQNVPFGCSLRDQPQKILYGGRWWLPPSPGRGESCVSKCPLQVPTPKGVSNAKLTRFGWFLDVDSHKLS